MLDDAQSVDPQVLDTELSRHGDCILYQSGQGIPSDPRHHILEILPRCFVSIFRRAPSVRQSAIPTALAVELAKLDVSSADIESPLGEWRVLFLRALGVRRMAESCAFFHAFFDEVISLIRSEAGAYVL